MMNPLQQQRIDELQAEYEPHFAWDPDEKLKHYQEKGWDIVCDLVEEAEAVGVELAVTERQLEAAREEARAARTERDELRNRLADIQSRAAGRPS